MNDSSCLQQAKICLSPNCSSREKGEISLLVIHNISLPPGKFGGGHVEEFFQNILDPQAHPYFDEIKELKVSSHLFIDRDGSITQFVPFDKKAWHAGVSNFNGRENCNEFSIGIELEGTDELEYTQQQYDSLVEVSRELMVLYPLITKDNIVGHCDIAPGRKTDPGKAFDWDLYRSRL
jgi:AmpD protein